MNRSGIKDKIYFLYTNIGRGHPFYLDGIHEALIRIGQTKFVRGQTDVFERSRGISKLAWVAARWLYRTGSSSRGIVGRLYAGLRRDSDYNKDSMSLRIFGRDLRREFQNTSDVLVVAHPLLVAALRNRPRLFYQHGEIVTPSEAVVRGASAVFVPTEAAAEPFLQAGYTDDAVVVTGLCIEPPLVRQAEDALEARLKRYSDGERLTGAFFSSGAEPQPHVEKLIAGGESLAAANQRAIFFAASGGRLASAVKEAFAQSDRDFLLVDGLSEMTGDLPAVTLIEYRNRRDLNANTARLFPYFDFFISPPHERTNWAFGLGLPIFILSPAIGPFAPLNRSCLLDERGRVGVELENMEMARRLGAMAVRLRDDGGLRNLAENGWNRHDITGFEEIARYLVTRSGDSA